MSVADLLARVEAADECDQGPLLRQARLALVPYAEADGPWISRFVQLIDAGGYESAALALVERVLPGVFWNVGTCSGSPPTYSADLACPGGDEVAAPTPALALLKALLRALIKDQSNG